MELVTPFAQTPSTPEPIIALVRRQLADDPQVGNSVSTGVLDRVADAAVRDLWSSPVKTFVPVLALRTARETLRDQALFTMAARPVIGHVDDAWSVPDRPAERVPGDVLSIDGDVSSVDDRDRLSL